MWKRVLAAAPAPALMAACGFAWALAGWAPAEPVAPERPQRIVSLDYCADQFVLKLADRDQIAAVSADAARDFSYMRHAVGDLPQVRASAEDVLAFEPDLVVRSYGGGPNVQALMRHAGAPLAQIGYAETLEDVRRNVREMAAALGHPLRGEALIAEMDARLAALPGGAREVSALYMTPAGVTAGEGTLVHELLEAAGLANFEARPGWRPIPLERLARERPDLVAAAFFRSRAAPGEFWSAGRHPLAQRQLRERPVAHLEGAWTACGGWFLVDAVEALSQGRTAVEGVE